MDCRNCKCSKCGRVNECEVITDRLEQLDTTQQPCTPILYCQGYSCYKDSVRYNSWECIIKNTLGGD